MLADVVMRSPRVAYLPLLSVTFTVKLHAPTRLGVPVIRPLPASVNPVGSEPLVLDQVYPGVPSVARSVAEYAWWNLPAGRLGVVMAGVGRMIRRSNRLVAVAPSASVTCTVRVYAPSFVGVPPIAPLVDSVRPGARAPE